MNLKRILLGKIIIYWCKWQKWNEISFRKYWSGRIFSVGISKLCIDLDCRIDWIKDMVTGKAE